jgi:hypothetical protein
MAAADRIRLPPRPYATIRHDLASVTETTAKLAQGAGGLSRPGDPRAPGLMSLPSWMMRPTKISWPSCASLLIRDCGADISSGTAARASRPRLPNGSTPR